MSTSQWGLELGQPVWFYRGTQLRRRSFLDGVGWDAPLIHAWGRVLATSKTSIWEDVRVTGVIVGVRTFANGRVLSNGDGVREFQPQETFRAALVATDIRHKPVPVRIEDIHVEEP